MGTVITGSQVLDWHQSELHMVLSSYLVLCLSAGLRALNGEGQSLGLGHPTVELFT